MFDISWGKLVIIGVVALLVIGPKELPAVLRMVGQWMGKMRRMAAEFQGQFQEAMREAEMADLKKSFDETTSSLQSTFDTSGIKSDIDKLIEDPLASAQTPPANVATSDPTTPAAPADPVALGTAPAVPETQSAEVSVPLPDLPPPVTEQSFAAAAPTPAPSPEPAAPGIAEAAPAEGGKAA
jgi:sec-independent protein translocase protein TatB